MNCPKCGREAAEGATFCLNCGTNLADIAAGASQSSSAPARRSGPPVQAVALGSIVALGVLIAVLFLFVLGGDDASAKRIDPEKADTLADVAVISVSDLPGSGWELSEVDEFDDEGPDYPAISACQALENQKKSRDEKVIPSRAGRAQRGFELTKGLLQQTLIEVSVEIYRDEKLVSSEFDKALAFDKSGDFDECTIAYFQQVFGNETKATAASASGTPPEKGVAKAFKVESSEIQVHSEFYTWQYGNSVVQVELIAVGGDLDPSLVTQVLSRMQARVELAAGSNPPTPVPAALASATPGRSTAAQPTTRPSNPTATPRTSTPAASATRSTGSTPPGTVGKLGDLDSYRFKLRIEGEGGPLGDVADTFGTLGGRSSDSLVMEVMGAYVKPDRGQQTLKISGFTVEITTIGRQQWLSIGGLSSGPPQTASRGLEDYSFAASFWDDGFISAASELGCTGSRETINGVATRKCGLDADAFEQLRGLSGGIISTDEIGDITRFSFQLWVAESGGYPIRLRLDMAGKDKAGQDFTMKVEMDITDVNSRSIVIEPPR